MRSFVLLAYRKVRGGPKLPSVNFCLAVWMLMLAGLSGQALAQGHKELRVAAAADLQPVMPVLATAYEHATGVKLVVSFGSSATLTTQILNGAPIDLFLGADFVFPEKIVAAKLTDATAPTPYAKGSLVLWARKDSAVQPITIDSLTDKRATSIAIADEMHAPYGRAAVASLTWMKIYDKVKPHLVVAENVAQAGQFAESGNAQMGLISLTLASTPHFQEIGTYVLVPTTTYPPIRQCAVILKAGRKAEADAFLKWLLTPGVQANLPKYGLAPIQ